MSDTRIPSRVPKYRASATFLKGPIEDENFESLIKTIVENKDDGIVMIKIGDRDVCSLKIDGKKIYINEVIDETRNELSVISQFPVNDKVALRAMVVKYIETLQDDMIEDTEFIKKVKSRSEGINEDNLSFILSLWGRFWDIRTRFRGDTKDGIYIEKERDIYAENDKNTLMLK